MKNCQYCAKSFQGRKEGRFCSLLCARHARIVEPSVRFFGYIEDQASDCWNWTGHIHHSGYGMYRSGFAHRFSYAVANGPIPDGLWVLHKCDNRKCVNPSHLFLGTRQDNVDDMMAKGRGNKARGEAASNARLSAFDVIAIRNDMRTQKQIAGDYGIARSTVQAIKAKRNWAHVHSFSR